MGSIKDIITAIEVRLTALGFIISDEVFDFDSEPTSKIDNAYRIETRMIENTGQMFNLVNTVDEVTIYIAYKAGRNRRTVWKSALDDRETIEVDLINAAGISGLSSDPLLTMDQEASQTKELTNYIISRLVFAVDYVRDVSPS
uniref:Tail protein n=1 Tax=viral metagenome TaxID=1070528 RepID=A0A6H1ZF70_9ZZZZ